MRKRILLNFLKNNKEAFVKDFLAGLTYPDLMLKFKLQRYEVVFLVNHLQLKRKDSSYVDAYGIKHQIGVRGSLPKGLKDAATSKGKIIKSCGLTYIHTGKFVFSKTGKRRHHKELLQRHLVEKRLGRALERSEWVIFKDGNKNNFNLSNLKVVNKFDMLRRLSKERT